LTVTQSDLFGVFYVLKGTGSPLQMYFKSIEEVRPLFIEPVFEELCSGFYLSIKTKRDCTTGKKRDSLRISYFTPAQHAEELHSFITKNLEESGFEAVVDSERPRDHNFASPEYELRFRRYLVNYTLVGLDLIEEDLDYARRLGAWLHFHVMPAKCSVKEHIEPSLIAFSKYFRSMNEQSRIQFLDALTFSPSWTHMFLNFLGIPDDCYVTANLPISIINTMLGMRNAELEIPEGWIPVRPRIT